MHTQSRVMFWCPQSCWAVASSKNIFLLIEWMPRQWNLLPWFKWFPLQAGRDECCLTIIIFLRTEKIFKVSFCFFFNYMSKTMQEACFTCAKSIPGGKEPGAQSWGVSGNPTAFPSLPWAHHQGAQSSMAAQKRGTATLSWHHQWHQPKPRVGA